MIENDITYDNKNFPKEVVLRLCASCNLKCDYCYSENINNNSYFLSLKDMKRIIEYFISNKIHKFILSGGEPLLRNDLKEIIALISKNKTEMEIITNGILLESNLEWLNNCELLKLRISINNWSSDNRLTTKDEIFIKTLKLITKLKMDRYLVSTNIVLTNKNYIYLNEIIDILFENKVDKIYVARFLPLRRRKRKNIELILGPKIVDEIIHRLNELKIMYGSRLNTDKFELNSNFCKADKGRIIIDVDGRISTCITNNYFDTNLDNILNFNLDRKWNSPDRKKVSDILVPEDCYSCKFNNHCFCGCKAYTYAIHEICEKGKLFDSTIMFDRKDDKNKKYVQIN